jgi:hypothetical protein
MIMTNLKTLSKPMRIIEVTLLSLFFLFACSESKTPEKYIAKVDDSYLTESGFEELIDSQFVSEKNKSVVIKSWVRQEVLYQEAVRTGLTDSKEFKQIIENTKKQLAAAMVLEKYAATIGQQFTNNELEDFFEENESSFKLPFNAYFLNRVNFSDREAAVNFRSNVILNGWDAAIDSIHLDTTATSLESKILVSEQDIQPPGLQRVLEGLYPLEISIVIPDERGYYSVVQLIDKYSTGEVPAFDAVIAEVESRYKSTLTELAIENYIEDLYSKSEIEINK